MRQELYSLAKEKLAEAKRNRRSIISWSVVILVLYGIYGIFVPEVRSPISVAFIYMFVILAYLSIWLWEWMKSIPNMYWGIIFGVIILWSIVHSIEVFMSEARQKLDKIIDLLEQSRPE
ncbi:MAG: hypothetical protein WC527_00210 [Candidatus Margulisiibacteriota bacterium]